jgi:hypothetical protein
VTQAPKPGFRGCARETDAEGHFGREWSHVVAVVASKGDEANPRRMAHDHLFGCRAIATFVQLKRSPVTDNLGTIPPLSRCALHAGRSANRQGEIGWSRNSRVLIATLRRSLIPMKGKTAALYVPVAVRFSQPGASSGDSLNRGKGVPKSKPAVASLTRLQNVVSFRHRWRRTLRTWRISPACRRPIPLDT